MHHITCKLVMHMRISSIMFPIVLCFQLVKNRSCFSSENFVSDTVPIWSPYIHCTGGGGHCRLCIGVGRGTGGANAPPPPFLTAFLELYINCRMVAPNCCARPVA